MSLLLLSFLFACAPETDEEARAYEISDLGEAIGGPKAIARPGDYILENEHIRIAILGARNSYGPGIYGGSLIDADKKRPGLAYRNANGNDHFVELNPTTNLDIPFVTEDNEVEIIETDDGSAIVRVTAKGTPYLGILVPLRGITPGSEPSVAMVTDYILRPGEPWITLRTTATIVPASGGMEAALDGTMLPPLFGPESVVEVALGGGLAMGDFYQQGGAVDAFISDIGFDEAGAVNDANQAGENLFWAPLTADFLAGTADGVSYAIAPLEGKLLTPLFASSQTVAIGGIESAPESGNLSFGSAYSYERIFTVGDGDVGSAVDNILQAQGVETATIRGHVLDAGGGSPISHAKVFVYKPGETGPWSQWTTDVDLDDTNNDGSYGGTLPLGEWEVMAYKHGHPASARIPVEVTGDDIVLNLELGAHGTVDFEVRDETGQLVPSKITLMRDDGTPQRNPALGDGFIGGNPEAVLFAPYGTAETSLVPGSYTAYATRGPEYDFDTYRFEIQSKQTRNIQMTVYRAVDTSGWVGADLHVHAMPSFDSGVTAPDRVVTMVSEGVEFMASTDHDFIFDYAPTIEDLGLTPWIKSSVGVEVTPLEMGHYIAFGVEHDFLADAGGAFDWKGQTPGEVLKNLKESGNGSFEPVTFVAHPRDGILGYFDQYGFDPYGGIAGSGGASGSPSIDIPLNSQVTDFLIFTEQNFTLDFDAIELFNGKRLDFIRTPTQPELDAYATDPTSVSAYDMITRDIDEMQDLLDGTIGLGFGHDGQIDDWFTLLNLGYKHTALANSDTHGKTSIESGCPRNFVASPTDDPAYLTEAMIGQAVRDHQVIASYGPFVRFWIEDDGENYGIGSELTGTGERRLEIESQAPVWMGVDHLELYENGTLIKTWDLESTGGGKVAWNVNTTINPTQDSWYVVIASGSGSLWPLFSPVEIPKVELQDIVVEAVGAILDDTSLLGELIPTPRTFGVPPYALTNPIWIDLAGDGFDAPGVPAWQIAPEPSDDG